MASLGLDLAVDLLGYYSGKTADLIAPTTPANDPVTRQRLWQATAGLLTTKGHLGLF